MPNQPSSNIVSWASQIDENTIEQATRTSKLPFLAGHLALMPDAHYGRGSTVGSVIPTKGAIIPAAIGVDIGCGMAASMLNINASQLPDNLHMFLDILNECAPGGVGKSSSSRSDWGAPVHVSNEIGWSNGVLQAGSRLQKTAISQIGTLGGGNHFIEICTDEKDNVWVVLHSGSRGVGNQLAKIHIDGAKKLMKKYFIELEDPDLAYLVEGTEEFDAYITDMLWAQDYAALNRRVMMDRIFTAFSNFLDLTIYSSISINCHHNFTQQELIGEGKKARKAWITRKGAISARQDEYGIIPGSMGTSTFIVKGKGNPSSYHSCSHGAGRVLSRGEAKRSLSVDSLKKVMKNKHWLKDDAEKLLDEHPDSYKDIHQVMQDQQDLVTVESVLTQILNYKGVN